MSGAELGADTDIFMAPEDRAEILGIIINIVAPMDGPVSYSWLFDKAREAVGIKEEKVGLEILRATSILILAGIFDCNTHDKALGEIIYCSDTNLRLGKGMMSFIWKEELNDEGGAAI